MFENCFVAAIEDSNPIYRLESLSKTKSQSKLLGFLSVIIPWLGIVNLFQTFEDLDSVKDKQAETEAVRQVLDEDEAENGAEAQSC